MHWIKRLKLALRQAKAECQFKTEVAVYKRVKLEIAVAVAAWIAAMNVRMNAFLAAHGTVARFAGNRRGVVSRLIMLCVSAYVAGATIPPAIVYITNVTLWEGAPTVVTTLGTSVIGIVIVTVVILLFLRSGGIYD